MEVGAQHHAPAALGRNDTQNNTKTQNTQSRKLNIQNKKQRYENKLKKYTAVN